MASNRRAPCVQEPPATTPIIKILVVEPERLTFTALEFSALLNYLDDADKNSFIKEITSVDQLLMSGDGTLFDGYKPTGYALYQLSRYACPGLYRLLLELVEHGAEDHRLAAISIYNQIVRLYYRQTFIGKRFLCNKNTKLIDALVSESYTPFSNVKLLKQTSQALFALKPQNRFQEAVVCGRWMYLRYYTKGSLFKIPGTAERFFSGYYFSNHEGGLSALKGTNMLIRADEKLGFIHPAKYARHVKHIGSHVQRKFDRLMEEITTYNFDPVICKANAVASMQTSLGLGLSTQEEEEKREYKISRQIQRWKIPVRLTEKVVANLLVQSYKDTTPVPLIKITQHELQERSAFDLAISLAREAKAQEVIAIREDMERKAFLVLMGKLRIK